MFHQACYNQEAIDTTNYEMNIYLNTAKTGVGVVQHKLRGTSVF